MTVDEFMEQYWHWPVVGEREQEEHEEFLLEKYGKDVMDEYQLLTELITEGKDPDEIGYLDFIYRSGLYEDISLVTNSRTKATLSLVLEYLQSVDNKEKIADLGFGDGRISCGIAKFFPDLMVKGLDKNRYALQRGQDLIQRLELPNVKIFHADFMRGPHLTKIAQDPCDVVLTSYSTPKVPTANFGIPIPHFESFESMAYLCKRGGIVVSIDEIDLWVEDLKPMAIDEYVTGVNQQAFESYLEFELERQVPYYNDQTIMMMVATKQ